MAVSSWILLDDSYSKAKVYGISLNVEGCIGVEVDGWKHVKEPLDDAPGAGGMFRCPGELGPG